MRKVLYRAAVVLALATAAVTGVTTSSAGAVQAHQADGSSISNPAPAPADWWW